MVVDELSPPARVYKHTEERDVWFVIVLIFMHAVNYSKTQECIFLNYFN